MSRTRLEERREVEETIKEFNPDGQYRMDYSLSNREKQDLIIVRLPENTYKERLYFYRAKKLFKEPTTERYEVFLKGDMLLKVSRDTHRLEVINVKDNTLLKERIAKNVSLIRESERLTKEYIEKLFLY